MVARAVSPTSAATSTTLPAATMGDFTAAALLPASKDSSACAEPFARDRPRGQAYFGTANEPGERHETHADPRRTDLEPSRTLSQGNPQRPDPSGRRRRRDG